MSFLAGNPLVSFLLTKVYSKLPQPTTPCMTRPCSFHVHGAISSLGLHSSLTSLPSLLIGYHQPLFKSRAFTHAVSDILHHTPKNFILIAQVTFSKKTFLLPYVNYKYLFTISYSVPRTCNCVFVYF